MGLWSIFVLVPVENKRLQTGGDGDWLGIVISRGDRGRGVDAGWDKGRCEEG